jgi:hypothetical protein
VQVTCGVFMALSWITVLLRLYTRGVLVRNIGADDLWILLAAVCLFVKKNLNCIFEANYFQDLLQHLQCCLHRLRRRHHG